MSSFYPQDVRGVDMSNYIDITGCYSNEVQSFFPDLSSTTGVQKATSKVFAQTAPHESVVLTEVKVLDIGVSIASIAIILTLTVVAVLFASTCPYLIIVAVIVAFLLPFCATCFDIPNKETSTSPEQMPSKLSTEQRERVIRLASQFLQPKVEETKLYSYDKLSECGNGCPRGEFIPFSNFSKGCPYTYRSDCVSETFDQEPCYHEELAGVIIQALLGLERNENCLERLQFCIKQEENQFLRRRALQVAAILCQVGDQNSPLPKGNSGNNAMYKQGGAIYYDPMQRGQIILDNALQRASGNMIEEIQFSITGEVVQVCELDDSSSTGLGPTLARYQSQRTITVGVPDAKENVTCSIEREYKPLI